MSSLFAYSFAKLYNMMQNLIFKNVLSNKKKCLAYYYTIYYHDLRLSFQHNLLYSTLKIDYRKYVLLNALLLSLKNGDNN